MPIVEGRDHKFDYFPCAKMEASADMTGRTPTLGPKHGDLLIVPLSIITFGGPTQGLPDMAERTQAPKPY
jgi:hypothetical protein